MVKTEAWAAKNTEQITPHRYKFSLQKLENKFHEVWK